MSDRIENFDVLTPRDCYDQGYDDGLRRGLEVAEQEKLRYSVIERHLEALQKAIARHNSVFPPAPIVVKESDFPSLKVSGR